MSQLKEKIRREQAIFRLIENRPIGTQGELVSALVESGFEVTQATVSRDVKRLGLLKQPLPEGGYRYSAPPRSGTGASRFQLESFVTGMSQVEAFYVLNTLPGRAMLVAVTIDELGLSEIGGTLAGDDLVLVLIKKEEHKERVKAALSELF